MELISSYQILRDAQKNGYAVPAFNIHNLETLSVVVAEAEALKSPVILAATPGTADYMHPHMMMHMAYSAALRARTPVVLHLDHFESADAIFSAVQMGIRSVMFDASHMGFEENVKATQAVVTYCNTFGVSVESELGRLCGIEDGLSVSEKDAIYTDPKMAEGFVKRTGTTSLAVAIGTAHGFYKETPRLDLNRLSQIKARVSVPLVLHGASGVPSDLVRETIARGICKVNVATELKEAFSLGLKDYLKANPAVSDPRHYFKEAKARMAEVVREKITMCGSAGRAKSF